ncbi:HET-domain-containing protein [Apiospora rasikravindrae]|uniref:HET-domain-containing protein n=1 Tax=Apiospora rasikravindrae TaxID=990691 RepID=A0ABR1SFX0_9PEZI
MDWHDDSCRRLDLVSMGGLRSCLSCGSFEEPGPQDNATSALARTPSSGASAEPSHHAPIHQKSETRILILQPGEFEDPVHGDLLIADFSSNDFSSKEPYEALSYTWADESGDSTLCKTIQLSGHPFLVTANCENALRRLRKRFYTRRVWVDAICIDQGNISERGHQVQLMPTIYSRAQSVLIYVGEAAHGTDELLSAISSNDHTRFDSEDLKIFFERRYFSRIWVLQEVALARKAEMICGAYIIPWTTFKWGIASKNMKVPVLQFDHRSYTDPHQLVDMMTFAAQCQCEDPRDKVYSLLGLFPFTAGRFMTPDYSLSVEEVYADMARYIASEFSWAFLLRLASRQFENLPHGWPTWVPDWRDLTLTSPSMRPEPERVPDPSIEVFGPQPGNPDLSIDLRLLAVPCIFAEQLFSPPTSSSREPWYYLPDKQNSIPSAGSVMLVGGYSYMFRWAQNHSMRFPEQNLQEFLFRFTDVLKEDDSDLPEPHTSVRPRRTFRLARCGTEDNGQAFSIRCIDVPDLLGYLRDHPLMWDEIVCDMQFWVKPKLESWKPSFIPMATMRIGRLQTIAARVRPVDEQAEALWTVPDWDHLVTLKRRWISQRPWLDQIDLEKFVRIASTLPPVDGEAEAMLPEPAEDYFMDNLGWESRIDWDGIDKIIGKTWILERRRALAWKIFLRIFMVTELDVVVV